MRVKAREGVIVTDKKIDPGIDHLTVGEMMKTKDVKFHRRQYGSKYDELVEIVNKLKVGETYALHAKKGVGEEDLAKLRDQIGAAVRRGVEPSDDRRFVFRLLSDGGVAIVCAPPRRRKAKKT